MAGPLNTESRGVPPPPLPGPQEPSGIPPAQSEPQGVSRCLENPPAAPQSPGDGSPRGRSNWTHTRWPPAGPSLAGLPAPDSVTLCQIPSLPGSPRPQLDTAAPAVTIQTRLLNLPVPGLRHLSLKCFLTDLGHVSLFCHGLLTCEKALFRGQVHDMVYLQQENKDIVRDCFRFVVCSVFSEMMSQRI